MSTDNGSEQEGDGDEGPANGTVSEDKDQQVRNSSEPSGKAINTIDLIEGYHAIAEWIRFADAKAAVVLTVGAALGGLVVPTLRRFLGEDITTHPFPWWPVIVGVTFALWLFFLLLSGICAFLCIQPFRRGGKHPSLDDCKHFHPAAISASFNLDDTKRFSEHLANMGDGGLRKEVAACILIDSHISSVKYRRVTASIRLMGVSAVLGLVYLVLIQF
ncbi:MAG: hypothetical protein AAF802_10330 [Planctomycetota bacterium]